MISFERNGNRFNHRAAGACLNENHILLQTTESADFHILPGGRIEMGEDSETALKREMREELGSEIQVERLLWIVENFFTLDGENHHEVAFIYEITPNDEKILAPSRTLETTDAGVKIFFWWHPLEEIERTNLKPSFLREALEKLPEAPQHLVIREKKLTS
ncbi:MAG: NUDIX hydrolase [Actinomycetota bacterium]|jgi:ADP-ribose pyrophosphatase YjhB (NUDIX family)|nr:NUDIX hydrolase [Actinomycetota bacterium]